MPKQRPNWVMKCGEISRLAKIAGIDLYPRSTVQVLFRDFGDPIGSGFYRPLFLSRDGRAMVGAFSLADTKRKEFVFAPWYGSLKTFVADLQPGFFALVAKNKDVTFIDGSRRDELKARIEIAERKEAWLKIPRQSSSLEDSASWGSIFSPKGRPSLSPSPSLLPPQLVPVSR
jgi:hypothetical protein